MDSKTVSATEPIIKQYCEPALQAFEQKRNQTLELFNTKKLPVDGWSEADIEALLHNISMMDSNNYTRTAGVGERESRFASNLVARRHFRMGHGIGRSGDITEIQPKAAGSSLMNRLANEFVLDILRLAGAPSTKKCLIFPMATGMSLVLCLRALHSKKPEAKYVIWSRVDQKSCFKCMLTAGLTPIIIHCTLTGGRLMTDTNAIREAILKHGVSNIVCILTTTSCFAPRSRDCLVEVGQICHEYDIPHLVNNAYGIQSDNCMQLIETAAKHRVDLYVSSTDKNFMVPVGGSVIAGFSEDIVSYIGALYPGRASLTPSMDVFITLLNLGKKGYQELLRLRKEHFQYLKAEMGKFADKHDERILPCDSQVTIGMSLSKFSDINEHLLTEIGSMLFSKYVSGARVISMGATKNIGNYLFNNWGSHSNDRNCSYVTVSASLGVKRSDIDLFVKRLGEVFTKAKKNAVQMATAEMHS